MFYINHNRLTLQFHITGRCNLRCKHCYRTEGDVEPLTFADIKRVIDQFIELKKQYNTLIGIKKRGHINITGGEPFCHKDILKILEYLGEKKTEITYGILSNGSFIDDKVISILKETEVSFVQLSIDGNKKIHDALRAPNDFERVFNVAKMLKKHNIRTYISFTANKNNYTCLPEVAKKCREFGVTKLWSDRLVPIGNGADIETLKITDKELPDYLKKLKKAQGGFILKRLFPKTQISMDRALQFIGSKGSVYSCSAGVSLLTVDEFGNIMPCRRLPIICGNIFFSELADVYFNDSTFLKLREKKIPEECINCQFSLSCNGGAKCQSYAQNGNFDRADPACPFREK